MKTKATQATTLALAVAFKATFQVCAIENLTLRLEGSNVVLAWPSVTNETFIVQYRSAFHTNSPWVTLTNGLPAAVDTNWTKFVHSNVAQLPEALTSGASAGGASLSPSGSIADSPVSGADSDLRGPWGEDWKEQNHETRPWKAQRHPPYPWEVLLAKLRAAARPGSAKTLAVETTSTESGSSQSAVQAGFYRVVRKGAHAFGLTNGTFLTGLVELPLELGYDGSAPPEILVEVDGACLAETAVETNALGNLVLKWDTSFSRNGARHFSLLVPGAYDEWPASSGTNTILVSNMVSFFDYPLTFGSQMWILAELAVPQANFEVWLLDDDENPVVGWEGSTTNGFISFLWDLQDEWGNTVTNECFEQVFYVSGSTNEPPPLEPTARAKAGQSGQWSEDDFIVAWGESGTQSLLEDIDLVMTFGVVSVLDDLWREDYYVMSPGNVPYGSSFMLTPDTRSTLMSCFANPWYRNFFWFGHGNSTDIGYDANIGGERGPRIVSIPHLEIARATGNAGFRPRHPYRFVFLHSCLGARGLMARAFGIATRVRSVAYYDAKKQRARAFIGSTSISSFDATQMIEYGASLQGFFVRWMEYGTVSNALARAKEPAQPGEPRQPLISDFTIYGAPDLQRDSP